MMHLILKLLVVEQAYVKKKKMFYGITIEISVLSFIQNQQSFIFYISNPYFLSTLLAFFCKTIKSFQLVKCIVKVNAKEVWFINQLLNKCIKNIFKVFKLSFELITYSHMFVVHFATSSTGQPFMSFMKKFLLNFEINSPLLLTDLSFLFYFVIMLTQYTQQYLR